MPTPVDAVRLRLARAPQRARQLTENLGISQPTVSRALRALGEAVVRIGAGPSIQYALRDRARGLPDMPVFRVTPAGTLQHLGTLVPVCPQGFVMCEADGRTLYTEDLPWWLDDMRPQGYLGRAYAARHGAALALPERLADWNATHALTALLAHGDDAVGNLLIGDQARERFLAAAEPLPVPRAEVPARYVQYAVEAARGEAPGSSAGGEQPKFTAYVETPEGPRHVLVKFSEREAGPVSERWRDLLLAEHLALQVLRDGGVAAARSTLFDHDGQRFLEVERFDRVGARGRRALLSLRVLDAEFVGTGNAPWPAIVSALVRAHVVSAEAVDGAALLWAFGSLIGNTDMHAGNLSFLSDHGRPYALAPAYDMTPMAFSPRAGGGLPDSLAPVRLRPEVPPALWRRAERLARDFLARLHADPRLGPRFRPCLAALAQHLEAAARQIARLA